MPNNQFHRCLAVVIVLGLSACASPSRDPAAPLPKNVQGDKLVQTLEGNRWNLVSATDSQNRPLESLAPRDGKSLSLVFKDNVLNITGGCNQIRGSFVVDGGKLEVRRTATSLMVCEPKRPETDIVRRMLLEPFRIEVGDARLRAADRGEQPPPGRAQGLEPAARRGQPAQVGLHRGCAARGRLPAPGSWRHALFAGARAEIRREGSAGRQAWAIATAV
jgi:heat shock protein HslJ